MVQRQQITILFNSHSFPAFMITKSMQMFMLILMLFFLLASKFSSSNQSLNHEEECLILFQFKENMPTKHYGSYDSYAYPKVASWKINRSEGRSDCCLWDGVECNGGEGSSGPYVIALDLSSSFLYGHINSNSSLFDLVHLRRLNLAENNFRFSQIPFGIGRLSQLTNLNLSYSLFSGHVPKEVSQLSQLVSLDLSGNPLRLRITVFKIVVQNSAKSLKELFLSEVNIDSEVPDFLANLSSLRSLGLRDCRLRGEFPTSIFHLPMLQLLDVQDNSNVTGHLPDFHYDSQLKVMILARTNFNGKVPGSMGNLMHLNHLDLGMCSFLGSLPGSVSNLTRLTFVNLTHNIFSGPIPSLASLSRLKYLDLSYNEFDGRNLSNWLGKLPSLYSLNLDYNNLCCEIPSSIGNQTQLRELRLYNDGMVGHIPSSIVNLTYLTVLDLGLNDLIGSLPSIESLSKLTYVNLSWNNLDTWKLPNWLGKLNKLQVLILHSVNLYGDIPSLIFNLTQVKALGLAVNQIEGTIPAFPSTMIKLKYLHLGSNHLKGPIPKSMWDLKNLEWIILYGNNIGGTMELDLFRSFKKLKVLYIGGNRITLSVINNHTTDILPKLEALHLGSCNLKGFPGFLRFQDQLQELHLDDNKIDGLIPEWMGNISKETLKVLSLSRNSLTGFELHWPVVPWVGLLELDLSYNMLHGLIPVPPPSTLYFMMSNNKLTGKIPPSICDLQSIWCLDLSFNNITGSIPPCLEKLSNSMLVLNLRGNMLRGTIPNTLFTNGSMLQMIDLSENQLEGHLPRSLENCASLQILDFGNNCMEGIFPFWLGALPELQVLILRSNKFHGAIRLSTKTNSKFPKLHVIDLSYNSFSGDLPSHYFQERLAIKENEFDYLYMHVEMVVVTIKGSFSTWGYLYSMMMVNKGVKMEYKQIIKIFTAVDLSSNKFGGKIPESITSLHSLNLLNLSNNELSGVIPSSVGNMTQLESLDLSGNKLSGKIPQQLVQLNFLVHLNVSYNNLTGPIPQGGQFNTFENISYIGNLALCGFPLSKKCGNSKVPKSVSFDEADEPDFPSGVDWVVILAGVGSGLVIGLLFGNHLTIGLCNWFLKRFKK